MDEITYFTRLQQFIFNEITKDSFFRSNFYFTGGTALSAVYLHHRESDDLDFFSENNFDTQVLFEKVSLLAQKHNFDFERRQIENVHIYNIDFLKKTPLKVDFVYYPHKRIEKGAIFNDFNVDSLSDIATNKLLTIGQRTEVKDFVDLFYLLEKFSIWDLMEGLRIKFNMKTEPFFIASDIMKVEDFTIMPRMIKPLTLDQLKTFFVQKAKEIGKTAIKP